MEHCRKCKMPDAGPGILSDRGGAACRRPGFSAADCRAGSKAYDSAVRQLDLFFGLTGGEKRALEPLAEGAENQALESLSAFDSRHFHNAVNPCNSVIYCNYLYWLSRLSYQTGSRELADKIYYLNKALNGVELYFEAELPKHWSCEHPLGSVMGKAQYGGRLFFYQGCTVGGSPKEGGIDYPVIGDNVWMYADSKILGSSRIGNNVVLSAGSCVLNETVPDNVTVFGRSPHLILKQRTGNEW